MSSGIAFAPQAVAGNFSRAAADYDSVATVQRTAGHWLLQGIRRQQELSAALDVGCGSGALTAELARRLPMADVTGIDIAPGMLDVAATRHAGFRVAFRQGSAETIPFAEKSFDLVFSNFMLQWCVDPLQVLTEMRRVLRRNGQLVLSLPGRGSLAELAAAWRAADDGVHVHPFLDADTLAELADAAGFAQLDVAEQRHRVHVPDAVALMRELKGMGAHNLHPARRATLTGRGALQRVQQAYETRRVAEGLPVTWNVLLLTARR